METDCLNGPGPAGKPWSLGSKDKSLRGFIQLAAKVRDRSPSPSFVPAGVRENPAHPLDGTDVHWTSVLPPSLLPKGEGGEPRRATRANAYDLALPRLLQLASPSLPVGAYSFSEGLEYAVHAGWVGDALGLHDWLHHGLLGGAAQLEAAVLVRVYDAWRRDDLECLRYWDEWLSATRETEELRNQSLDMGRALLRLLKDLEPPLPHAAELFAASCNFATAFGIAAAHWGISREDATMAYLQNWAANSVSAGVKLIPLGQTAGQQLLWDLQGDVAHAAQSAQRIADDELSVGNWGLALASMAHETQYSRLFRS